MGEDAEAVGGDEQGGIGKGCDEVEDVVLAGERNQKAARAFHERTADGVREREGGRCGAQGGKVELGSVGVGEGD